MDSSDTQCYSVHVSIEFLCRKCWQGIWAFDCLPVIWVLLLSIIWMLVSACLPTDNSLCHLSACTSWVADFISSKLCQKKQSINSEAWVKLMETEICLSCPSKVKLEANANIQQKGRCALFEAAKKLSAKIKSLFRSCVIALEERSCVHSFGQVAPLRCIHWTGEASFCSNVLNSLRFNADNPFWNGISHLSFVHLQYGHF